MNTADFDYVLDPTLIAPSPLARRDQSRLLVYDRKTKAITHDLFSALERYLSPSDLLVVNNTRVIPARVRVSDGKGKPAEIFFLRSTKPGHWEVLIGGAVPNRITLSDGTTITQVTARNAPVAEVRVDLPDAACSDDPYAFLQRHGEVPLPPYILKQRKNSPSADVTDHETYQTVYAEVPGSVAAPTAGLHFTQEMLDALQQRVRIASVTLHIGIDTFRPIRATRLEDHPMHREWCRVPPETSQAVSETRQRGGRVIAVGTTVVRALESHVAPTGEMVAGEGETGCFIRPGDRFGAIDGMVTNFHLPRSTLLVLVSAFAGCEEIRRIYAEAIDQRYRFYSYGDAMMMV
jgi:S-adenosylmethionine:tRNA ribosyltransferase-isomerase